MAMGSQGLARCPWPLSSSLCSTKQHLLAFPIFFGDFQGVQGAGWLWLHARVPCRHLALFHLFPLQASWKGMWEPAGQFAMPTNPNLYTGIITSGTGTPAQPAGWMGGKGQASPQAGWGCSFRITAAIAGQLG